MGVNAGKGAGIICVALGAVLALIGAGVLLNFSATFRFILGKKVVLAPTSQGFPIWRDVSDHLDTRVAWYFFNLTNPDEFVTGATPVLEEVGPFWYKAVLAKKEIHFHDNKTVSFEEHRTFHFDAERSVLPEDTRLTMVNVPLMAALNKVALLGYFSRMTANSALGMLVGDAPLTTNYSINELTYGGQYNTLVALSKAKEGIMTAIEALNSEDNKKGKFGFAIDKNETNPGIFNMYTGATGVNDLNRIYSMNNEHILDLWAKEEKNVCNVVDGTFGYLRPPMTETDEQKVYVPDMCRAVTIRYEKDVQFDGIRLRRFTLGAENFASSDEKPENFCYDRQFKQPSGVSEVGPCKQGAPILMSMPHFMGAKGPFAEKVKGMNPVTENHTFIMDHEPTTGMTVSVRGRLQANIHIVPTDVFGADKLPNVILPLFWQEMYVEAGHDVVSFLHKVLGYPGLAKIALVIMLLIGLIIAIIGAGLLVNHQRRTSRSEELAKDRKVEYSKAPTNDGGRVAVKPESDALV